MDVSSKEFTKDFIQSLSDEQLRGYIDMLLRCLKIRIDAVIEIFKIRSEMEDTFPERLKSTLYKKYDKLQISFILREDIGVCVCDMFMWLDVMDNKLGIKDWPEEDYLIIKRGHDKHEFELQMAIEELNNRMVCQSLLDSVDI